MTVLVLSYLAGLLATLNPCILPVLPLVLAGTLTSSGRLGPIAYAAGLTSAFLVAGLVLAGAGSALGLSTNLLRRISALAFFAFGFMLLAPRLGSAAFHSVGAMANFAGQRSRRFDHQGYYGTFVLGALAGIMWTPCAGPSLGAALALAAEAGGLVPAAVRILVFGLGAATIIVALAYGSRTAITARRDWLVASNEQIRQWAGIAYLAIGIGILAGWDKRLEARLTDVMPDWLIDVTTRF